MNLKRKLKREVVSLITDRLGYNVLPGGPVFGRRIEKQNRLGYDRETDWKRFLSRDGNYTLFDVGANVGQTALTFSEAFPHSTVFSFEPDPLVYEQLRASAKDNPRIRCFNMALGARDGQATLFINGERVTNSLLDNAPESGRYVDPRFLLHQGTATVDLTSIDSFCRAQAIPRIDLLKIDAQGYELRILEGAGELIRGGSIPLIYLEVSFVPIYQDQPLFHQIYQHMLENSYRLVGLYGACSNLNYLVSTDALFVLD